MASSSNYDPTAVIAAANEKLLSGDLEGGQFLFQSSLLEWTDDAREVGGSIPESLREAVSTLWLAYAQFLIQAKQFKSATEAYEEAIHCPVAGASGRVYAEYARFAIERNKRKTAQDVYLKALVQNNGGAVQDEQDRGLLWNEFLEMMRTTNPDLTMAALRKAVTEQDAGSLPPPSKRLKLGTSTDETNSGDGSVSPKLHIGSNSSMAESKTHVVTAESVEMEANRLTERLLRQQQQQHVAAGVRLQGQEHYSNYLPPDIMAAWMSRDGNYPPQAPEPALFAPSPPKLSDPTGKDILGVDLAEQLVERLLSPSGGIVLEVCRALWTLQSLKEHESQASIAALDKHLMAEHERLESELDARLSVAGAVSNAVSQMNERERQNFQVQADAQRQHALNQTAWDFRQLLCWQQQALAKLDVPGFKEGPTVDASALQLQSQICQYLHSAFYIRNRMGSEPHETMLRSQLKKLQKEQQEGASRSPKVSHASSPVPMVRHSPIPPPSYNNNVGGIMVPMQPQQVNYNPYPPQQPQLQAMMGMPPQHAYAPLQGMYGQPPPMMMMQQQQQQHQQHPYMQQLQQMPLPPLPPNQPQPPPYYGGQQQQYPYYQQ